ncbi:MAG: hypothetical protein RLZZ210_1405 [Pseudomonadota bacterium]|jgi:hypothetical protein
MMTDTKEKKDNQIEEVKEVTKRKFSQPFSQKKVRVYAKQKTTDVSTTIRIPEATRSKIANYCNDNLITMNTFITNLLDDFFSKKDSS